MADQQIQQIDPSLLAATKQRKRPRYTFTIPPGSRLFDTDPTTVTFVPITVDEELIAVKTAKANGSAGASQELIKITLVAADGKELDWGSGARDSLYEKASPPVRQHIIEAWTKVNTPPEEASKAFLGSMRVEV